MDTIFQKINIVANAVANAEKMRSNGAEKLVAAKKAIVVQSGLDKTTIDLSDSELVTALINIIVAIANMIQKKDITQLFLIMEMAKIIWSKINKT
jgi:hypothetical protein